MASEPRERKDFLLRIRVTQEQRREIEAAAKKMKMDLSSWADLTFYWKRNEHRRIVNQNEIQISDCRRN